MNIHQAGKQWGDFATSKLMNRTERTKLERLINSLSLKPVRNCKTLHHCLLCDRPILLGENYRDGGYPRRAHATCFDATAKMLKESQ